jgi:histidinol-phosphate phosphatase family protein
MSPRRLRIVRVMPWFDPATRFGGPVTQAREVCRALAARGHEVRVLTTDIGIGDDLPRDAWIARDGYHVWYGRARPWHRKAPYPAPFLRRPLVEALAGADVLCLNVGLTLLNDLAARLARRAGVPWVYNAEGALDPVRLRNRRLSKRLFLRLFERSLLRGAAAVQAVSEAEARHLALQGADPSRLHLVPNGVELPDLAAAPGGSSFRRRFAVAATAPLVLHLGRVTRLKGLDLLLPAFAAAVRRQPQAVLAVVGPEDASYGRQLVRQANHLAIADRVRFTGQLDGELRQSALRAADVFALASRSEGLPIAVLEACSFGLPVLITTACNLPEVAAAGAGLVVEPREAEIAAGLASLLADPDMRAGLGERGRRLVAEHFTLDRVVDRLAQLYGRIARAPAAGRPPPASRRRAACFLDRDGVVVADVDYLTRPQELALLPGAAAAIATLNRAGVPAIVVTNQSAIARGMLTEAGLRDIHATLDRLLAADGARIDRYYHCPHHPTAGQASDCDCRKPKPGMLRQAAADFDLDLAASLMVGDKLDDVEAGARAGCRTCLVRTGYGKGYADAELRAARFPPDTIAADLAAAVATWLGQRAVLG